jgi:hypothetical protein
MPEGEGSAAILPFREDLAVHLRFMVSVHHKLLYARVAKVVERVGDERTSQNRNQRLGAYFGQPPQSGSQTGA